MSTHTARHAIYPGECSCTRAERLAACVICGRRSEFFTTKALEREWDTCSSPCWQALRDRQRNAPEPAEPAA